MTRSCDIAVLGGGPAGCLAAMRLAGQGYDVAIVSTTGRLQRLEGLSERIIDIFGVQGCHAALDAVGPTVERLAIWNGESVARNRETIVDRRALDDGLRQDVRAANVDVIDAKVGRVALRNDDIEVRCAASGGKGFALTCRYLVEARGRRAPAPSGRREKGPSTTALTRTIRGVEPAARTVVASHRDGWLWFVSVGDGVGHLQIFLDSEGDALPKKAGLAPYFDNLAAELGLPDGLLDGLLDGGRFVGAPQTRDASSWIADGLIDERTIRIGDAAVAVDPLSGHGIFEALGSALAAGAAVHTILSDPRSIKTACDFYSERATDAFYRYCRVGRDFYALETRWPERPFWRRRANWPDEEPSHRPMGLDAPRVEMRPVVENGLVVSREVCVTPDHPRGVWRIADVPVVDLARLLSQSVTTPLDDLSTAAAHRFDIDRERIGIAIGWLRYRGILDDSDGAVIHLTNLDARNHG